LFLSKVKLFIENVPIVDQSTLKLHIQSLLTLRKSVLLVSTSKQCYAFSLSQI
jgi:hypothetical protein